MYILTQTVEQLHLPNSKKMWRVTLF